MLSLTESNRIWLNERFAVKNRVYLSHEPIWGYRRGTTETGHLVRFARTLQILRMLSALQFRTFCDVGAAEGYTISLVRALLNPERPVAIDLSLEAARRAHELFGLLSCSADAACLPFKTDSFDVVLCSEVIEHLERPFAAIGELLRICRHYLLVTTEVVGFSPLHRLAMLKTRQIGKPHYDRNIWLLEDFEKMFGEDIVAIPQFFASSDRNDPESSEVAHRKLLEMAPLEKPSRSTVGLVILIRKDRSLPLPPPSYRRDEESITLLFAGPLSLPRSEPQTWSADDLDKLVVKDQPTGVGTLDLSGIDRASSPTGNDKRSLPHAEQLSRLFREANRANVVTYPFWRVLRRTLRSWG